MSGNGTTKVLIAGGGVAGVEALLALRDLAGDAASVTMVAPEPEFTYRPLLVGEPFGSDPAERHDLAALAAECGAEFVLDGLASVDPEARSVGLTGGGEASYDELLVCAGGRFEPAFEDVITFPSPEGFEVDSLLERAEREAGGAVVFLVPAGVAWALPIYELALMTAGRARKGGGDAAISIVSPESDPLIAFGPAASAAVREMLDASRVEFRGGRRAEQVAGGAISLHPGGEALGDGLVVALPVMRGREIQGLPADDNGFIPIDDHARVVGVEHVHAAGDGTNFPIKQGGLATQQADAAASDIAASIGAIAEAEPFHPVLRGKLFTAAESLHMSADVAGGAGDGTASHDPLWWPPDKISGRYLAGWLHDSLPAGEPEVPPHGLDVEVAVPKEWHREPMAVDPLGRIA